MTHKTTYCDFERYFHNKTIKGSARMETYDGFNINAYGDMNNIYYQH